MEYVYQYLVFLAEAVTIVIALLVVLSAVAGVSMRNAQHPQAGHLRVEKINDRVKELRHTLEAEVLPPGLVKKQHKVEAKAEARLVKEKTRAEKKATVSEAPGEVSTAPEAADAHPQEDSASAEGRVFVLRFEGDVKASAVEHLRTEVSAVLTMATPQDEVVVAVESPGGMVHGYGLAASQLTRFRDKDIPLTVIVDKVAASGGYLMAAVASKIIAAPFALVGSIGVVAQVPNVHRLLKKNDVDVEVITAGKHKRTLTTFGENTEEGRQKFIEEIEDVHALFQEFVQAYRPQLDMDTVATGEAWYGRRALDLKLVDELSTSDDYVLDACARCDVFSVKWEEHKKPIDRVLGRVNGLLERVEQLMPPRAGV